MDTTAITSWRILQPLLATTEFFEYDGLGRLIEKSFGVIEIGEENIVIKKTPLHKYYYHYAQ